MGKRQFREVAIGPGLICGGALDGLTGAGVREELAGDGDAVVVAIGIPGRFDVGAEAVGSLPQLIRKRATTNALPTFMQGETRQDEIGFSLACEPTTYPQAEVCRGNNPRELSGVFQRIGVSDRTSAALWAERHLH
jgi:hypothetical protein